MLPPVPSSQVNQNKHAKAMSGSRDEGREDRHPGKGSNEPLSNNQIDELKEAIIVHDKDGDGTMNSKELGYV